MEGAHLLDIGGGLLLGGLQAEALGLLLPADVRQLLLGLRLGVLEDLGALLLRLLHQVVRHPLGGHQGLAHGLLGGAVLLHLVHQHLHLGLQGGVLLVQGGVVHRQHVQELVHHGHVVSAERRLGKGVLRDLLRCQHRSILPVKIVVSPRSPWLAPAGD